MSKRNEWVLNLGIFVLVSLLSLGAAETVVRFFFKPMDFLLPVLVEDPVYRYRIRAGSAGHDSNGFRNENVPESVDIVTIGDSQTYGTLVPHRDAWPAVLQNLTGKSVYNMALGGYGPAQYYQLLIQKALPMHPKIIIFNFYLGNDLMDAFNHVYETPALSSLRDPKFQKKDVFQEFDFAYKPPWRFLGAFREWLACHSVVYRLITAKLKGIAQLEQIQAHVRDKGFSAIQASKGNYLTTVSCSQFLVTSNLEDPRILEGLRLTELFAGKMNDVCRREGIACYFITFPSKVYIYDSFLQKKDHSEICRSVIKYEKIILNRLKTFFEKNHMAYIDAGDMLRSRASLEEPVCPKDEEDHLTLEGNRLLAQEVADVLKKRGHV